MFNSLYVIVELPVIVNTVVYIYLSVCYCRATSDCIIFMFLGLAVVLNEHAWHTGFVLWAMGLCLIFRFASKYVRHRLHKRFRLSRLIKQKLYLLYLLIEHKSIWLHFLLTKLNYYLNIKDFGYICQNTRQSVSQRLQASAKCNDRNTFSSILLHSFIK